MGFGTDHEAGGPSGLWTKWACHSGRLPAAAALRFDDDIAASGTETFTPTEAP